MLEDADSDNPRIPSRIVFGFGIGLEHQIVVTTITGKRVGANEFQARCDIAYFA